MKMVFWWTSRKKNAISKKLSVSWFIDWLAIEKKTPINCEEMQYYYQEDGELSENEDEEEEKYGSSDGKKPHLLLL